MTQADRGRRVSRSSGELFRYAMVVVIGLGIDLAISLVLRSSMGLPLVWASAGGFLISLAFNYLGFELWVFRTGRLGLGRLGKAYLASGFALSSRFVAIWMLNLVWMGAAIEVDLAKLLIALGFSFIVNFAFLKRYLRAGEKPEG